jgi:hypothetical protein
MRLATALLEQLKRIPQNDLTLEADVFLGPASIGEQGQRPLALYLLMVANSDSGFILGTDAMTAENSLATMRASVPNSLAKMLLRHVVVPKLEIGGAAMTEDFADAIIGKLRDGAPPCRQFLRSSAATSRRLLKR